MSKADLIATSAGRANPMIWEGEEAPEGVFLGSGVETDPLALLGTPSLRLPEEPRLPADYAVPEASRELLGRLLDTVREAAAGATELAPLPLDALDAEAREALGLMLGEGEVSGRLSLDGVDYRVSESLMAGLWRVQGSDGSAWLEVGPVPAVIRRAAESLAPAPFAMPEAAPGVMNGLAVLAEVSQHAADWDGSAEHNRVLNFTLMPMSPEDQALLLRVLGRAELALESGGFGQCNVLATTVRHVWAVQYLNAMGHVILDTLEIGRIPDAVLASREDFEDSCRRLERILETYLG